MTTSSGPAVKPWTGRPRLRYRFLDAKLIDPKDGNVYEHVTIYAKDGVIAKMERLSDRPNASQSQYKQSQNVIDVDLNGRYVMPGLIDCHVHLATPPGEEGLKDTLNQHPDTSLLRQPYLAHEILKRGFTTIRDCGGAGLALKEALDEELYPGPRLYISGHGISQTGGHGDLRSFKDAEYACCGGNTRGLGRVADGVDQCLHAAREELRQGADFIKIMVSGGVASTTDKLTSSQYTPEEIRAITRVAQDSGTYVTAHAYTPTAIRNAIENGVRGIEHGNLLDEATARLMQEKGAFLTPTLVTYEAMASDSFSSFLPPEIAAKNLQVLKAGFESIQLADRVGVTMCFGTDLLGPMQIKQTREFGLRVKAGLSNLKILQSATVNAAKMLRNEKLGRLSDGQVADMLILNANPLEDISILDRPHQHLLAVIKNGRVVESRWTRLPAECDSRITIE